MLRAVSNSMPSTIQGSNCCNGIKNFVSQAASSVSRAASKTGHFFTETLAKTAAYVKPHFQQIKDFATTHTKELSVIGVTALIVAVLTATITGLFYRGTNTPAPTPAPAPAPVPATP